MNLRKSFLAFFLSASLFLGITVPTLQPLARADIIKAADDTDGVQVPIPANCRVYNRSGSQCVWASLEVLARYHKISELYTLTQKYKHATGGGEVRRVLNGLHIKYIMQDEGEYDTQILVDACAKGWGAGVGLHGTHMVNVVHFKDGVVKIIDNSDSSLKIRTLSMNQFLRSWDGWVVVLIPPNPPEPPQKSLPPKVPEDELKPRPPSSIKD